MLNDGFSIETFEDDKSRDCFKSVREDNVKEIASQEPEQPVEALSMSPIWIPDNIPRE